MEGKGKPVFVVPKKFSPKLLINANYTIPAFSRSGRRRLHFVPISQFYGINSNSQGITPADLHCGYLLDDAWSEEDWTSFYETCIFCIHEYLQKRLLTFDDSVLADRQLLAAAAYDDSLLQLMKSLPVEATVAKTRCSNCSRPIMRSNDGRTTSPIGRPDALKRLLPGWDIRSIQVVRMSDISN